MSRHIGEIAIRSGVWAVGNNMLEPGSREQARDDKPADAMERRVDDLCRARSGPCVFESRVAKVDVDRLGNDGDVLLDEGCREVDAVDFLDIHHAIDDVRIMRREDLATRRPVDLDRIITRWVVRCRYHDAAGAAVLANCEGELRSGAIVIEEIDVEPVGDHDRRAEFCEMARAMSRVVGDRTREVLGAILLGKDVVREALGALTDRAIIDRIGSDGVHSATASAGSERDDGPVGIIQLFPSLLLDVAEEFWQVLLVSGLRQPIRDVFLGPLRDQSLVLCRCNGIHRRLNS